LSENPDVAIKESDIVIIGNHSEEFESIDFKKYSNKYFIDLVRINNDITQNSNYTGVGW